MFLVSNDKKNSQRQGIKCETCQVGNGSKEIVSKNTNALLIWEEFQEISSRSKERVNCVIDMGRIRRKSEKDAG